MKNPIAGILLLFVLTVNFAFAKNISAASDADTLLAKVVDGFADVRDFIVKIDAEVKMEQVQVPNMHATMYFKKPDKIHFDSEGFLFVPRDGIALNPVVLSDRYNASLDGIGKTGRQNDSISFSLPRKNRRQNSGKCTYG